MYNRGDVNAKLKKINARKTNNLSCAIRILLEDIFRKSDSKVILLFWLRFFFVLERVLRQWISFRGLFDFHGALGCLDWNKCKT